VREDLHGARAARVEHSGGLDPPAELLLGGVRLRHSGGQVVQPVADRGQRAAKFELVQSHGQTHQDAAHGRRFHADRSAIQRRGLQPSQVVPHLRGLPLHEQKLSQEVLARHPELQLIDCATGLAEEGQNGLRNPEA